MKSWHPAPLLATWFGIGLLPGMPGTWGSLAALPAAALLRHFTGGEGLLIATVAVFLVGTVACDLYIRRLGIDDPSSAVIDEVAGQFLPLLFLPLNIWVYLLAFILFRAVDILKPWPIGWLDGHLEGGLGTMIDDSLAGIYALIVLALLDWATGGWIGVGFDAFG